MRRRVRRNRIIVHKFDGQRHRLRRLLAAFSICHRVAKGLGTEIVLVGIEGVVATGGEICGQDKRAIGQAVGTIIILGQAFCFKRIGQLATRRGAVIICDRASNGCIFCCDQCIVLRRELRLIACNSDRIYDGSPVSDFVIHRESGDVFPGHAFCERDGVNTRLCVIAQYAYLLEAL